MAPKLRLNPPDMTEKERDEFIQEGRVKTEQKPIPKYPWSDANPDIVKIFNLRLPQPDRKKIEYIIGRKNIRYRSIHEFILNALQERIEQEIKELLKEGDKARKL